MSAWELLSKKNVFENKWRALEDWEFSLPRGGSSHFTIHIGADVVVVFGLTTDKKVLVAHEFFMSMEQKVPSLVAGRVEDDLGPLETAKKELMEEAGCTAQEWISLGSVVRDKYSTGTIHFYLASGVEQTQQQALEPTEDIDVAFVTLDAFEQLIDESKLQSSYDLNCALKALRYIESETV